MEVEPPRLVIVGGPNGCGKTTFARAYAKGECLAYLGADDIAVRLRPDDPYAARIVAGKTFGRELTQALEAGTSLVVESTLSGGSFVRYVERAKELGYAVTLVFVFLDSPKHCLRRIEERVAQGGHDVPEADVRRRYARTFRRFWNQYRALAHVWILMDNVGATFTQVAGGDAERTFVYDEARWNTFVGLATREESDAERDD